MPATSNLNTPAAPPLTQSGHGLARELTLTSATALNMIDMIGVGPFITIPLMVGAMGGPQAMLGWILGAVLALCDGMVWAELGASFPGAGGSYQYLKECFGPHRLGRLLSFLFVWQLSFSAPLSIASGCIGLSQYAAYLWPAAEKSFFVHDLHILNFRIAVTGQTGIAIAACLLVTLLLYRRIGRIGWISQWLWLGVIATLAWVIFAGFTHFNSARAFDFPPGAFHLGRPFLTGLGAALLVGAYDYWGYYNVCFLGGEVKDPTRNIPRALIFSILAVAAIYLAMNISILGVVPWRELDAAAKANTNFYVVSLMMQRVYGSFAARLSAVLIMWTAFASVFSLMLGYSRVPYAAALDGNYFRGFARVHPRHQFPHISLLALAAMAIIFCFFRLQDVIAALVVIRMALRLLAQAIGLLLLRARHPETPRPFRMWLYPLPALLAIAGFLYVLFYREHFTRQLTYALLIAVAGAGIYFIRAIRRHEWPLIDDVARF